MPPIRIAAALALLIVAAGSATARGDDFTLPCAEAPPAAVTAIPAPLDSLARVLCTRSGHLIVARPPLAWTLPGERPMVVLAVDPRGVKPGDDIGHAAHFTTIDLLDATETARGKVAERMRAVLPQHAGVEPTGMRGLGLVTADARRMILWLFHGPRGADGFDLWGTLCGDADCAYDRETLTGLPFTIKTRIQ